MTDTRKTGWRRFSGGLAFSVLLHALAVAVFLLSFDNTVDLAEQEQAVEVTLVPPPPEPEAEPPAEDTAEAETPEPPAPEPEPEPPALEAEPPTPEPQSVEQPPVPEDEPDLPDSAAAPIPVLRPVVRFGERDSGPELSRGTEAERQAAEEAKANEPSTEVAEAAPKISQPEIELPEAPAVERTPAPNVEDMASPGSNDAGGFNASINAETEADTAQKEALRPREVKRLMSRSFSEDEVATDSIAGLTREERIMDLCGTELSMQLRSGSPRYEVEYLPSFKNATGNVFHYPRTAFRQRNGVWLNVAVVCEVDDKATRVLRFAYSVGKPVPRSEWAERGFPDS